MEEEVTRQVQQLGKWCRGLSQELRDEAVEVKEIGELMNMEIS